jgi:hypothetical protein
MYGVFFFFYSSSGEEKPLVCFVVSCSRAELFIAALLVVSLAVCISYTILLTLYHVPAYSLLRVLS